MLHLLTGVALGAFFIFAGIRKWTTKADNFAATMRHIGYAWAIPLIPLAQILGGVALGLNLPLLAPLAAIGLALIMLGAFVYTSLPLLKEDYEGDGAGFVFNAIQKPEILLLLLLLEHV